MSETSPARISHEVSRRAFLKTAAAAPWVAGLSVPALGAAAPDLPKHAKSILLVWLWGAPSHLDTCDPKPDAPVDYRGPFSSIATKTPGLRFSELLPRLAQRTDKFSIIRSNVNYHNGHLEAGSSALTGTPASAPGMWPNYGSILAKHRGYGQLPPFMEIGSGHPRDVVGVIKGYGGGDWGPSHDPFRVECSAQAKVDIPDLRLLDGLAPERLADRRKLLTQLDVLRRRDEGAAEGQWNSSFERAYGLLTSPEAQRALDLSRENPATRDAYGHTAFGQSLLLGRRLVESGVPYVQVNWSQYVECMTPNADFGWDTHIYNFESLADRHCPIFDRAFPALLDDLAQRGLSDDVLVVAMGEFGRSPLIGKEAARDHWPRNYFSIWSGGGVKPGRVIGASDKLGNEPVTEPITPVMVGTTMLELAGVTSVGRAELKVLDGGRVIHELM